MGHALPAFVFLDNLFDINQLDAKLVVTQDKVFKAFGKGGGAHYFGSHK